MRMLLDQNIVPNLVPVLAALGHEVASTNSLGLSTARDIALFVVAEDYDVFMSCDLFRQEEEWYALVESLIGGNIRLVRVQLPKRIDDLVLETVQIVVCKMQQWLDALNDDAALVILSASGSIRRRTRQEVETMLVERNANRRTPRSTGKPTPSSTQT